jgi:hypothetical protein
MPDVVSRLGRERRPEHLDERVALQIRTAS